MGNTSSDKAADGGILGLEICANDDRDPNATSNRIRRASVSGKTDTSSDSAPNMVFCCSKKHKFERKSSIDDKHKDKAFDDWSGSVRSKIVGNSRTSAGGTEVAQISPRGRTRSFASLSAGWTIQQVDISLILKFNFAKRTTKQEQQLKAAVEQAAREAHVRPPGFRAMQSLISARAGGSRSSSNEAYNNRCATPLSRAI